MLTDTHCHLNAPEFAGRGEAVVARAREAGVGTIIVPGWDADSSRTALALAAAFLAVIRPAVGLHPWFVTPDAALDWLPPLLEDPRVVAIGEIGLDWTAETDPRDQEAAFRRQLALARAHDLPVLLHGRRGWDRLFACLDDLPVRGVLHAFSGSREVLREGLWRGLYVSFAGMVTRRNSRRAHEAALATPLDRLLLETDAPYMALEGIPAADSEPALLPRLRDFLATLRGEEAAALEDATTANAGRLFGV